MGEGMDRSIVNKYLLVTTLLCLFSACSLIALNYYIKTEEQYNIKRLSLNIEEENKLAKRKNRKKSQKIILKK